MSPVRSSSLPGPAAAGGTGGTAACSLWSRTPRRGSDQRCSTPSAGCTGSPAGTRQLRLFEMMALYGAENRKQVMTARCAWSRAVSHACAAGEVSHLAPQRPGLEAGVPHPVQSRQVHHRLHRKQHTQASRVNCKAAVASLAQLHCAGIAQWALPMSLQCSDTA